MLLHVIGTGSAGNAYLLQAGEGNDKSSLLLDAGVDYKKLVMACGYNNLTCTDGCLITHEHGDHMKHALSIAELGLDLYATKGTFQARGFPLDNHRIHAVEYYKPFEVGEFKILAFPTQHDAEQPCGFLIYSKQEKSKFLYATDTYYLRNTFPGVHFWLIECNYVDDIVSGMVADGEIPSEMRKRLLTSHMSLKRLKDCLSANDLHETRRIILCHLSDARSDEKRMIREVNELTGIDTVAASNGMMLDLSLSPF